MARNPIKILIAASEAVPFAKVGGLADVAGALGKEIEEMGQDVCIIIPKYSVVYDFIEQNNLTVTASHEIIVNMENGDIQGNAEEVICEGLRYILIDNAGYFKRDGIYADTKTRGDYPDSLERFTYFCKAVLEAAKAFSFQPDIIQINDWQTGLIPVYLKTLYRLDPFFKKTHSVHTIHNLSYQGIFPVEQFTVTGLDWKYFTVNGLEYYGHLNMLKGGIVFSDVIATVSETYAREIQTPEYGNGLEGILKEKAELKRLFGVVNGVNYREWDPKSDVYLKKNFSLNYDFETYDLKKKIKEKFLKDNKISNPDMSKPLIGMVSRLVDQKGFDLIFEVIDDLLKLGVYLTILGTGKLEYENRLKSIQSKYQDKVAIFVGFDIPTSHFIEAASDIFIMPSRFEPCGLNQLYSMKYGTIPVARNTGGLADTIKDGKTGFVFNDYSPEDFLNSLKKAIAVYKDEPEKWMKIVEAGMKEDWSWERAAKKYIEIYQSLLEDKCR